MWDEDENDSDRGDDPEIVMAVYRFGRLIHLHRTDPTTLTQPALYAKIRGLGSLLLPRNYCPGNIFVYGPRKGLFPQERNTVRAEDLSADPQYALPPLSEDEEDDSMEEDLHDSQEVVQARDTPEHETQNLGLNSEIEN
jgi:hypothetical protein